MADSSAGKTPEDGALVALETYSRNFVAKISDKTSNLVKPYKQYSMQRFATPLTPKQSAPTSEDL